MEDGWWDGWSWDRYDRWDGWLWDELFFLTSLINNQLIYHWQSHDLPSSYFFIFRFLQHYDYPSDLGEKIWDDWEMVDCEMRDCRLWDGRW